MRWIYTLLSYIFIPFILLRLLWRGLKNPAYRQRWHERFGFIQALPTSGCIWLHAVSVGETRAALLLVQALKEAYKNIPILLTTTTPTGSQQVQQALGDSVHHVYLPYDLPDAIHRFLKRARPQLAVIMETELWPNLFHACAAMNIPLLVANARLSERSARRYAWFARSSQAILACSTIIAAQSKADGERFKRLGATPSQVHITGNIKYDLTLPSGLHEQGQTFRKQILRKHLVWIAASTHDGEDEQVLDAFENLRDQFNDLLLLIVPRHPERFDRVAELCRSRKFNITRRSAGQPCHERTDIFLGDSMGELLLFYASADIAFIGGSLIPHGGHNVLEPALLALPVVFGPHMFNFSEASARLLQARAALQAHNAEELAQLVAELLLDRQNRLTMGARAKTAVDSNRGALAQLFSLIENLLASLPVTTLATANTKVLKNGKSI